MSYVSPALQSRFESLSIDLKNEILSRNVTLNSLQDLIEGIPIPFPLRERSAAHGKAPPAAAGEGHVHNALSPALISWKTRPWKPFRGRVLTIFMGFRHPPGRR